MQRVRRFVIKAYTSRAYSVIVAADVDSDGPPEVFVEAGTDLEQSEYIHQCELVALLSGIADRVELYASQKSLLFHSPSSGFDNVFILAIRGALRQKLIAVNQGVKKLFADELSRLESEAASAKLGGGMEREALRGVPIEVPDVEPVDTARADDEPLVQPERREAIPVDVYTDASQAIDGESFGLTGWVRARPARSKKSIKFNFSIQRAYDVDQLEALGILLAILDHRNFHAINIFSDSQHGIKIARRVIRAVESGGIIDSPFLRGVIRSKDLMSALERNVITISWVRSHSGNRWNEAADKMVKTARHNTKDFFTPFDEVRQKTANEFGMYAKKRGL